MAYDPAALVRQSSRRSYSLPLNKLSPQLRLTRCDELPSQASVPDLYHSFSKQCFRILFLH
jgi:hypothetical protein